MSFYDQSRFVCMNALIYFPSISFYVNVYSDVKRLYDSIVIMIIKPCGFRNIFVYYKGNHMINMNSNHSVCHLLTYSRSMSIACKYVGTK